MVVQDRVYVDVGGKRDDQKAKLQINKLMDVGHWVLSCESFSDDAYGFIYCITNLCTNKKYIGKKQCKSVLKRPPLKGKKNKRHIEIKTGWRDYTSSSTELNRDIAILGKKNFKFEIIKECSSKFELSYFEAKLQFDNDVLLRDDYYNGIINCRIGRPPKSLRLLYT